MTARHFRLSLRALCSALLATSLMLGVTSCVVPEDIVRFEEVIVEENRCPQIVSVLPEKNLLPTAAYEEITFSISVIDPDNDPISISLLIDNQEKFYQEVQGTIIFNYVYQVVPRNFEDTDYIEIQAVIYDEGCSLPPLDWTVSLTGG